MKIIVLAGALVLTAGLSSLLAQAPAPKIKSNGERKAVMAIQTATTEGNPDNIIKACEDVLNNYADSDFKEFALTMEAKAYQMKGDGDTAQIMAGRALQVNPKAFAMQMLIADAITPNIKEHDLNYSDEIAKCTKLYNDAIENVKVAPKPNPQIADAEWENDKKYEAAQAYNGLGMLATIQKKNDDAIKYFQMALDNDPEQDAYATRLAAAELNAGKKAEALALCDKLLAKPNLNATIRQVVTNIKSSASH
ncbi:MAG TPA: tetratricopeptide repeat protein [Bryobacteraceae bacterium]|jgi:tetratricopeptide (TPR) repeat protein|nr:tetratricopeptide repeat protein [Bryobacteraceae bacterium]